MFQKHQNSWQLGFAADPTGELRGAKPPPDFSWWERIIKVSKPPVNPNLIENSR